MFSTLVVKNGQSSIDKIGDISVFTKIHERKMKTVITYGTFDLLHWGHISLLKRAKALGDYLIVGLSTDDFNRNAKRKESVQLYEERKMLLEAIRYVDKVIPENSWNQKIEDIKKYYIDIFTIGDDWEGKFDYLREFCDVVYLKRTEGISTSYRKKIIAEKFNENDV